MNVQLPNANIQNINCANIFDSNLPCQTSLESMLDHNKFNSDFKPNMDINSLMKINSYQNEAQMNYCLIPRKNKNGTMPRKKFTDEEDKALKNAVKVFGTCNWKIISSLVPGRNPRQCRDRYTNYLAPGLVRLEWTEQEDKLLSDKFDEHGRKWTKIRQFFPNRSANDIKNRYNYTVCHKYQKSTTQTSDDSTESNSEISDSPDNNKYDDFIFEINERNNFNIFNDGFICFDDVFV